MSRIEELKEACKAHKSVYLLISKNSLQVARYGWGDSLEDAKAYFSKWLAEDVPFLTIEDFVIVKIMKDTI